MEDKGKTNHIIATAGWGLLLIWWGVSIAIGPITIGMSAIGTGLIMLGANGARLLRGIPTVASTTVVGSAALVWGALDAALGLSFGASFAVLLIVIGGFVILSLLQRPRTA
jgi:hypothetical protein